MNHEADYMLFDPHRVTKPPASQQGAGAVLPPVSPVAAEEKGYAALRAQMTSANPISWGGVPAQIWRSFRIFACIVSGCWLVGWPIGDGLAYYTKYGTSPGVLYVLSHYPLSTVLFAIISPVIVLVVGYLLALTAKITHMAQAVSHNALTLMQSEGHAPNSQRGYSTGRQEVTALNAHIDAALARLADTESSIRQQVRAIDEAGEILENTSAEVGEKIAHERNQLIQLTEKMNHEADKFAAAIAEKAKLGTNTSHAATARLAGAEQELNTRLGQLEEISQTAMEGLDRLVQVMETRHQSMAVVDDEGDQDQLEISPTTTVRLEQAQQLIASESARLEHLMSEQRHRAERLASVITTQITRLVELDESKDTGTTEHKKQTRPTSKNVTDTSQVDRKQSDSLSTPKSVWRHILARAEGLAQAVPPSAQKTSPVQKEAVGATTMSESTSNMTATSGDTLPANDLFSDIPDLSSKNVDTDDIDIQNEIVMLIRTLQQFTCDLYYMVYDTVPQPMRDRFDNGERNIFAHATLEISDSDIRQRLLLAISTDKKFELAVTRFLRTFDALLEPASHPDASASLLDDYLNSPLGKVYLRIGSITGYFS